MLTQTTQNQSQDPISRHQDGSINLGVYLARGRKARSAKAYYFKTWMGKAIAALCDSLNLRLHNKLTDKL